MSSIPKINNIGKVNFAKFQSNATTTNSMVSLKDYGYDSFTPSFKGGKDAMLKKASPNLQKGIMTLMSGLLVASQALTNTGCTKEPIQYEDNDYIFVYSETNVTISQEELMKYLQQILEALQEGNAQNAAFFQQIIGILADGGVGLDTIINYLEQNNQHLENLVQDNQELKEILLRMEALMIQGNNLSQEQNQLLSQILAAVLSINANQQNQNYDQIVALLNQLLDQLTQMDEHQAANTAAIIQALNHMNEQLQAKLLAILNAIQALPEVMQNGYNAILAQLQNMEASMQEALLNLFNNISGLGDDIQAQLNQLIALAGQMNQNMLACTAQILAQLQQMEAEQQQQVLDILAAMQAMGTQDQQNYIALMNLIQTLGENQQAQLLAILNQMIHMEDEQEQQYLSILEVLQDQNSENLAPLLLQILAQLQNMEDADEQHYLSILSVLQNNNMNEELRELLLQIIAQMQNMEDEQEQQYLSILEVLQNQGNENLAPLLLQILNKMQNMQDAQEQQYLAILSALQSMSNEDLAPLLLQILDKMQDMQDADEQHYLNVMTQLQNMAQGAHADFLAFMAKLTNLENGQQAILEAMEGMNAEFLAKFTQALAKLDTIIGNQATQIQWLAQIYEAIQNGNATLNDINDFLQNLQISPISPEVNLDVIEGLLAEILAAQNTANNLLEDMNDNLAFILTVTNSLQALMEQVTDNQEVLLDWQEAIWNKIPEAVQGCNCEECCAQLIEILQQISEQIENLDWNHEGIDDDLDPLLGK